MRYELKNTFRAQSEREADKHKKRYATGSSGKAFCSKLEGATLGVGSGKQQRCGDRSSFLKVLKIIVACVILGLKGDIAGRATRSKKPPRLSRRRNITLLTSFALSSVGRHRFISCTFETRLLSPSTICPAEKKMYFRSLAVGGEAGNLFLASVRDIVQVERGVFFLSSRLPGKYVILSVAICASKGFLFRFCAGLILVGARNPG